MQRSEGDWFCPDTTCRNLNFSKRTKCNICGKPRPKVNSNKQSDWTCDKCGNLNWAKRTHCNICNIPKPSHEPEHRLGRGGGYFDLSDPKDRKDHDSEDEEYDEFGRKKRTSKNKN